MKDDSLKKIMAYFFRYMWLVGCVLIGINFTGTLFTAYEIMKNTAQENITALSKELAHRIDVTQDLLVGISKTPEMADTSVSVADRAYTLKPFADAFEYWMIGVVDPDGSIASTRTRGSKKVQRDYIPRIMQTKKGEMTDVFPAGATGDLNVTQLVPVIRDNEVVSIVFAATKLTEIKSIITRTGASHHSYYVLLDGKGAIISHPDENSTFKNVSELNAKELRIHSTGPENFETAIATAEGGTFLSLLRNTLYYTVYSRLEGTNWTLIHRIEVLPTFRGLLIGFSAQALLFILVLAVMCYLGTLYMQRELQPVDNILKQVIDLNREILHSDKIDSSEVSEIIRISHRGLKDELTGLPTRMLFRQILNARMKKAATPKLSAIFFIDMDNLKTINDSFGHVYGDDALGLFGHRLQALANKYSGLCARYGGDEFLLFIEDLDDAEAVHAIAAELLRELRGKIVKGKEEHSFHSSIGVALYPLHSGHIDVVIQLADIALYESKQRGKDGYTIYSPEINRKNTLVSSFFFNF